MTTPHTDDVEERRCAVNPRHTLREDETTTCYACRARTRTLILEIVDAYDALPDAIRTLVGISYDHGGATRAADDTPVIGGDALVMLAGGTTGTVTADAHGHRWPEDQNPDDPPSVLAVLTDIEEAWWHAQGRPHTPPWTPNVHEAARFLLRHLTWASERHEGFPADHQALTQLHARAQTVTHTATRPETLAAPCMHCGGRIVRDWHTDPTAGLQDDVRCDGCGTTWGRDPHTPPGTLPAAYRLAQRAAIDDAPTTHPDTTVTLDQAKRILRDRVSPKTLDMRIRRGTVTPVITRNDPKYHLYRLADLTQGLTSNTTP